MRRRRQQKSVAGSGIELTSHMVETAGMKSGFVIVIATAVVSLHVLADSYAPLEHRTFVHDGVDREYFVHVPKGHAGPLPVVVAIHGYTSTATGFAVFHDLRQHANRNGYIVVYPQGTNFVDASGEKPYRVTSWNILAGARPDPAAGPQCLPDAFDYPDPPDCDNPDRCTWASCGDDLGYFEVMLDSLADEFDTDLDRYYVLGMSNGGMMALRLGCDLSERFAAIAPINAQLPNGYNCSPTTNLPLIHFSGGEDDTVRADGKPAGDGFIYVSAALTTTTWAEALQCESEARPWSTAVSDAAGLECTAHSNCEADGQEVVACQDPDETHNWPARRPGGAWPTCVTSQQADVMPEQRLCEARNEYGPHLGMDVIWEFFRRYSRQ